ncbi:hypothetical protein HK101_007220 [Irineochytrium annulatum]|nr:hypothetical protein HK101_007220 [Irineochytrium annulatum]
MANLTACIDLSATAACQQWAIALNPMSIPAMSSLIPALAGVTDLPSFDAAITSLNLFTQTWSQTLQCPKLGLSASAAYPLRYAESFLCGSALTDAIRGGVGVTPCVTQQQVTALPPLCKETCNFFHDSLLALEGCAASGEKNVYASAIANVCASLRASTDPVPTGQSPCVMSSYRDFASCGFGNSTAGIEQARSYCGNNASDPCCNYINQPASSLYNVIGAQFVPPTPPSTAPSVMVIVLSVIFSLVAVVAGIGAFVYFKRRSDNQTIGRGQGKGGFGARGVAEPLGRKGSQKGIVLGSRSRLSFAPQRRNTSELRDEPQSPASPVYDPKLSAPRGLGGNSVGRRQDTVTKKLGPTAATDLSTGTANTRTRNRAPNPLDDSNKSSIGREGQQQGRQQQKGGAINDEEWGSLARSIQTAPAGADAWEHGQPSAPRGNGW